MNGIWTLRDLDGLGVGGIMLIVEDEQEAASMPKVLIRYSVPEGWRYIL